MKLPYVVLALLTTSSTNAVATSEPFVAPPPYPTGTIGEVQISRDEDARNTCDIALYIQSEEVTQIAPGQSVNIQVPAGKIEFRLVQYGSERCKHKVFANQSATIAPGEVRHLRVVQGQGEVLLAPSVD
ncbi:hypothetical protein [Metapseudomonas boanensis]|uniref:Uncharacterized protein n=1 Tax=Metapseudomonas boanensis TaxID=2822138 RepID=A0ABS5XAK1_9GAMM|nr:hypothetical protein [Pseudomonas boanensis]MBT8764719.1 hypothetical protein [Pseudomonas boanensis]